jgi:hypothetical protein
MKRRTFIAAAPVLAAYAVIPKGLLGERVINAPKPIVLGWDLGSGDISVLSVYGTVNGQWHFMAVPADAPPDCTTGE